MKDERDDLGTAGPALRLLRAVEMLARYGPLSPDDLTARLGISRSATWRLVQNLREAGWARTRLGGRLIELDGRLPPVLARAHHADTDLCEVTDVLRDVALRQPVHLDLVVLDRRGRVGLHDSTRQRVDEATLRQGFDEACELAILSAMPSGQRGAYLAQMAEIGGLIYLNSRYDDPIKALGLLHDEAAALPGYAWENGTGWLVVGLRSGADRAAAVRISSRSATARRALIIDAFEDLRRSLTNVAQVFGKKGRTPRI